MCGISGIINTDFKKVEKSEIKKITDLIEHRGPDDEGFLKEQFCFWLQKIINIGLVWMAISRCIILIDILFLTERFIII